MSLFETKFEAKIGFLDRSILTNCNLKQPKDHSYQVCFYYIIIFIAVKIYLNLTEDFSWGLHCNDLGLNDGSNPGKNLSLISTKCLYFFLRGFTSKSKDHKMSSNLSFYHLLSDTCNEYHYDQLELILPFSPV